MSVLVVTAALLLIQIHGAGNEDISINIEEISSIRQVLKGSTDMHENIRCVIVMSNGRTIGTREPCIEVIRQINKAYPDNEN